MLHNPNTMCDHVVTFFDKNRKAIAHVIVRAKVYTIHENLIEMALKMVSKEVFKSYSRTGIHRENFSEVA